MQKHREMVTECLKKYPELTRDNLIPILQDIQEVSGYISREAVKEISKRMNLPEAKIYGVVTFYNQFRLQPLGKYVIKVCRGTACHVKGSADILKELQEKLGLKPGDTTRDGLFTLETVACIGACSLAPVISVNEEFHGNLSTGDIDKIIENYRAKEEVNR